MRAGLNSAERFKRSLAVNGESVTLEWSEFSGGTVDPTTGSREGGTATARSETVMGFVTHLDEGGKTRLKFATGIEECDAQLDVLPEVTVTGREHLFFVVGGERYVQADLGHVAPGQGSGGKTLGRVEKIGAFEVYRTFYLRKV